MARQPTATYDDDAPELTGAELAGFRPSRDVLSDAEFEAASSVGRGRPKIADPKVPVTIRLDRHVLDAFKATGRGWQTRVDDTLARSVADGNVATVEDAGTVRERAMPCKPTPE